MSMTASDELKQGEKEKVSQQAGLLAGSYSLKQCDTMGPRTQPGDSSPRQKITKAATLFSDTASMT